MAALGSTAWALSGEPPHGTLTSLEKARLFLSAIPVGLTDGLAQLARKLGVPAPRPAFEGSVLDHLAVPDSELATAAVERCHEVSDAITDSGSESWLLGHSYRTFAYGVLWSLQRRWTLDDGERELLFVASMLHDIELGVMNDAAIACFAARGGRVGRELAEGCGRDEIAVELEEAICVHLNPRVSRRMGRVAQLMAWGTALDFFGVGYHRLPNDAVVEVAQWAEHPRRPGLRRQMWCQWKSEQLRAPNCRVAFLTRLPGTMNRALDGSPFSEPIDAP